MKRSIGIPYFLLSTIFLSLFSFSLSLITTHAAVQDEISTRNQQIESLQRQIDEYQSQLDVLGGQSRTLENEISKLNTQIKQVQLEILSLSLSISQTDQEITSTQARIDDAEVKIELQKSALGNLILTMDQSEQQTLTEIFLKNEKLSDFLDDIHNIHTSQASIQAVLDDIRRLKIDLENHQEILGDKKNELEHLKTMQESDKRNLNYTKSSQAEILSKTKGQEKLFQELVSKSQQNITRLKEQVFYLQQNGVSAEDAVKYGQLAAVGTGIRPAYLIAVLEVESGLGRNVGKCNRAEDPLSKHWKNIMHTRDHQPFLDITAQLGLNPDTTAVSCPQFVNGRRYGWGGGMGPAQFIPSTWIGYKDEVSQLTGHSPANPWNIEDAFMAAAVKLARTGASAKTKAAEIAASKAYYSGNSKCSTTPCNSYANSIQRKATEIEKDL